MYETFCEKLTFLNPYYAHVHAPIKGKKCFFLSENSAYVLSE